MARYERRFPVPPVPTAAWSEEDWTVWDERHGVTVDTEPDTMPGGYVKTGRRNARGAMLYRLTLR